MNLMNALVCREYTNLIDGYFKKNGYTHWVHGDCVVTADGYSYNHCHVLYTNNEMNTLFSSMNVEFKYMDDTEYVTISTQGTTVIKQNISDAYDLRLFLVKYFPDISHIQEQIDQDKRELKRKTDMELYEFVRHSHISTQIEHSIDEIKQKFSTQFQNEEFRETIALVFNSMIYQCIKIDYPVAPHTNDHLWTTIGRLSAILEKAV